ncbi:MAG: peptidylprolyl isomerase [Ginsengibacter sp.]
MKKLTLVCLFSSCLFFSYGQVLFTYGNHPVSAAEFLKAFNKNKTDSNNDVQALRNYLDLYINFKLKVQAAKDMRLDTLASMKADVQNFRSQIQNTYLTDQQEIRSMTDQAFDRSQKDIHAVFYFLKPAMDADSTKAKNEIERFSSPSKMRNSEDIISQLKSTGLFSIESGDLGYITVFTLPYSFENIIYGIKPGELSVTFSAKNGWYIFKNLGERKAVGKITIAQILFSIPEGVTSQREEIKKLADSVYNALKKGSDFASLAKEFSDDRSTFMNGGLIPEFGTAKYDSTFEDHAFDLKENGDISAPFETQFGYHILKRISADPVPLTKTETYLFNLKQQVLKDSRSEIAQQKFIVEILPMIGFKKSKVNEKSLWKATDSLMHNKKNLQRGINERTVLFSFNDGSSIEVSDWISYLKNKQLYNVPKDDPSFEKLYNDYSNVSALSNYASRLDKFNPVFKAQLEEFKEGNMLFEIMQKKVWDKAAEDSSGLKNFYEQHKEKYLWNRSADAVIFSCSSLAIANNTIKQLKKGRQWRDIVNENATDIQSDSGRFDLGQIPVIDRTNFTDGLITMPVVNKKDGTAVFSKIIKIYQGNEPRKFEDARGLVINDYQNYLEENWISQLRKKYPVKVNETVFKSLLNKASD